MEGGGVIYIIGPISGRKHGNVRAFMRAYRKMKAEHPEELVFTPQMLYTPKGDALKCPALRWCEAMAECLPVAREADMIYALHDWQESPGARIEMRERKPGAIVEVEE